MSYESSINNDFAKVIAKHPELEEELLQLKLEVYGSLEWDDAETETAQEMRDKGYIVADYYFD